MTQNHKEYRLAVVDAILPPTQVSCHRLYSKSAFRQALADRVTESTMYGEFGYTAKSHELFGPEYVNADFISHRLIDIRVDNDGSVIGKVVFMDTDIGRTAEKLLNAGVGYGFALRALVKPGDIQKYETTEGTLMNLLIRDTVKIITFDIVATPTVPADAFVEHGYPQFDVNRLIIDEYQVD